MEQELSWEEQEEKDKLLKANQGVNLLNYNDNTKTKYHIKLWLEVTSNLLKTEEMLRIATNLPFCDYHYSWGDKSLEDFFEDLTQWVSKPQFNNEDYKSYNRRRDNKFTKDWYSNPFREERLKIEDIDIVIMPIAQEFLSRNGFLKTMKFTFVEGIKELLVKQKRATEEESVFFNRFYELKERLDDFKRQIPKQSRYGYWSDSEVGEPMKITLTRAEYNKRLRAIEKEMKSIVKNYGFLSVPTIPYWEKDDEEDD